MENKIVLVQDCISDLSKYPLAANLAVSLSVQSRKDVPLIDFSFSNDTDLSLMFNIPKEKELKSLIESIEKYGGQVVRRFFSKHKSGVIPVNSFSIHDNKDVTESGLRSILEAFKSSFSNIVVIAPETTGSYYELACDYMTVMLAGFSPNLLSINRLRSLIDLNKSLNCPSTQIKPVLCLSGGLGNIGKEQMHSTLKLKILESINIDKELLVESINEGEPFVLSKPNNPMSVGVKILARWLLASDEEFKNVSCDTKDKNTLKKTDKTPESLISAEYLSELRNQIHGKVIDEFKRRNLNNTASFGSEDENTVKQARIIIKDVISELDINIPRDQRKILIQQVADDILGYGCIEEFLKNDEITEIMVTGNNKIYVEIKGKIIKTNSAFPANENLLTVIDRIVSPVGRRIDESSPMVDARLKDGSRVNAVIPPLSLDGPVLTIRKFSKNKMKMKDLIESGALSGKMAEFLKACVMLKKNILISGGTGSGKTTLLNALSSYIDESERIITIEDSAELQLSQCHVVRMESRPPSLEGSGEISIRKLVINALRMRPDRIIVGECRGKEALDMLQAMNTGHNGSLTTIHANSPKDAVSRLTNMVYMAGIDVPEKFIREQIFSSIQIIVQLSRFSDGSRRVTDISEVFIKDGGTQTLNIIFKSGKTGTKSGDVNANFMPTGIIPAFSDEFSGNNINLSMDIFKV